MISMISLTPIYRLLAQDSIAHFRKFRIYTDITKLAVSSFNSSNTDVPMQGEVGLSLSTFKSLNLAIEGGYYLKSVEKEIYKAEGVYIRTGADMIPGGMWKFLRLRKRYVFVPQFGYRFCYNVYAENHNHVIHKSSWNTTVTPIKSSENSVHWHEMSTGVKIVLNNRYFSWFVSPIIKLKIRNKLEADGYPFRYIPGYGPNNYVVVGVVIQTGFEF